jgi:hypothetical protein
MVRSLTTRAKRSLGLLIALILSFAALCTYLQALRYGDPLAMGDVQTQSEMLARLEADLGRELPNDARVIDASDGDPWDGTTGFFDWTVFTRTYVDLPVFHGLPHAQPSISRLSESVRIMENSIAPFKIRHAIHSTDHHWINGDVRLHANVVAASNGYYISIQTYREQ